MAWVKEQRDPLYQIKFEQVELFILLTICHISTNTNTNTSQLFE